MGRRVTESLRIASAGEVLGKASLLAAFGVFATFKAMAVKSQFMSWEPAQGIESHIDACRTDCISRLLGPAAEPNLAAVQA